MKKYVLITIIFCLSNFIAFAQIDESDTVTFRIRFGITGNRQTGNIAYRALRSRFDYGQAIAQHFYFKTQNNYLYQEFFGNKADADLYSRNYLYFRPQHKVYPYMIAYISENFRRKIDIRYFVGAGMTYQILRKDDHVIKVSANTVYEQTNFAVEAFNIDRYNGQPIVDLWRSTLYLSGIHRFSDKRLTCFYDFYYQPAFDYRDNFRYQFDLGMDWKVWRELAFNISYNFMFENLVVENIKRDDGILTFGLAFNKLK